MYPMNQRLHKPEDESTYLLAVHLWLVFAAVFLIALLVRLRYAFTHPIPFSTDGAYYLMVAENLSAGRGFVSDCVWQYLTGVPERLPIPSNSYWMPGTSVVAAAAFALAQSTAERVAQIPFLVFGALLCALTSAVAGVLSRRVATAVLAGALAALSQPLVFLSTYIESIMVAACFVNLSLLMLWLARRGRLAWALPAGVAAAIAYLTRTDGALVVLVAMAAAIATSREKGPRSGLLMAGLFFLGFGLMAAPWWVRQTVAFGAPSPAGALRTAFFTSFEDIIRIDHSHLNLDAFLKADQMAALRLRTKLILQVLGELFEAAGLLIVPALFSLRHMVVRRTARPWLLYIGIALVIPALIFLYPTLGGGFRRLTPGLCPIIFALAAAAVVSPSRTAGRLASFQRFTALALIVIGLGVQWFRPARELAENTHPPYPLVAAEAIANLDPAPEVVFADIAPRFYYATHVPCVQFPVDGPAAALPLAESLGIRYFVTTRYSLQKMSGMGAVESHPRFEKIAEYPGAFDGLLVFRIIPAEMPIVDSEETKSPRRDL